MTGLVFTSSEEAEDLLDAHGDMRAEMLSEGDTARIGDIVLGILGVGKIKATLSTERLLRAHAVEQIVHVGTCTSLSDAFDPGVLVGASFVLEGDRTQLSAPAYPRMPLECPYETDATCTVVTQDHTVDDEDERSYWQRIADVNDTSSYAVAYVAAQHGVPCHVAKVVTSIAGVDSDSFQEDRRAAYTRLSEFVLAQVIE